MQTEKEYLTKGSVSIHSWNEGVYLKERLKIRI